MSWLDTVRKEWPVIKGAPWSITSLMMLALGAGWGAHMMWVKLDPPASAPGQTSLAAAPPYTALIAREPPPSAAKSPMSDDVERATSETKAEKEAPARDYRRALVARARADRVPSTKIAMPPASIGTVTSYGQQGGVTAGYVGSVSQGNSSD